MPHLDLLLRQRWRGLLVAALTSAALIVGPFITIGAETSKAIPLTRATDGARR